MKKILITLEILFAVTLLSVSSKAQMRPDPVGRDLPNPGPDRIEVRFAYDKKAIICERFHLVVRFEGRILFEGDFANGFNIPPEAKSIPYNHAVELELQCTKYRWRFTELSNRVFLPGYWWVGTDFPPFHDPSFQRKQFRDALWIKYLEVDPTAIIYPEEEGGFTVWRKCSKKLKNKNPGPCYD